jgi:hypothetical protein
LLEEPDFKNKSLKFALKQSIKIGSFI